MGGSSGGGGLTKEQKEINAQQKEINALTLERIKKEETDLVAEEAERQRLLSAGRFGRTSLLTGGFTGPGQVVRTTRAQTRADERAVTRSKAGRGRGSYRRRGGLDVAGGVRGPGSAAASFVRRSLFRRT